MKIQPKFDIGQKVFVAGAYYKDKQIPCPDCLGKKEWAVTTPAGESFFIPCNTCTHGWESTGTITEWKERPEVTLMTVGSIRIDTYDSSNPIQYMMVDTGVGSGQLHNEKTLFAKREDADVYATVQATINIKNRQKQEDIQLNRKKKEHRRKPEWYERELRSLRKQVAELSKDADA